MGIFAAIFSIVNEMQIQLLLVRYFDAVVVFTMKISTLLKLTLAILCNRIWLTWIVIYMQYCRQVDGLEYSIGQIVFDN